MNYRTRLQLDDGTLDSIFVVGFSPDESKVVTAREDLAESVHHIEIWGTRSGHLLKSIRTSTETPEGYSDEVRSLGFSPGGSVMATGTLYTGVKFWDTTSWRELRTIGLQGISECHFVSEDTVVLVQEGVESCVWDLSTGRKTSELVSKNEPHSRITMKLSSDNKRLIAAILLGNGESDTRWQVQCWSTSSWKIQSRVTIAPGEELGPSISPDGRFVAGYGSSGWDISVWNVQSGRKLPDFGGLTGKNSVDDEWYMFTSWATDGESFLVVHNEGTLQRCDLRELTASVVGARTIGMTPIPDYRPAVWLSADGHVVASISHKQISRNTWINNLHPIVRSIAGRFLGQPHAWQTFPLKYTNVSRKTDEEYDIGLGWIESARFSPSGSLLAVGQGGQGVLLYDLPQQP